MDVRRVDDLEFFAARVAPHLEAREAESNLELGILDGIRRRRFGDDQPLLLVVEDGGEVQGVAMRTPPYGLLLSSALSPAGAGAVAAWLLESDDPVAVIPGVQAETQVAAMFVDAWRAGGGSPLAVHREERIYQLTAVRIPVSPPAGSLRSARETDRGLLIDWFAAFAIDTGDLDEGDSAAAFARFVPGAADQVGLYLWEIDGEPCSMVAHSGPTPHGIRIGPVYTPPSQRRHGYAGAAVAAVSQHLLDGGREFCFLFTDLSNPTSNHIYREIGYEPVCDVTQYRVVEV